MIKKEPQQKGHRRWARIGLWAPLLIVLLLSMLTVGVMAQEDKDEGEDENDILFVEDEFTASPASVNAADNEVVIPPSKDAFIASNDRNRNFGFDTLLRFGFSPSGLGATRPLFKFKVEDFLPSDAIITKAELHVYLTAIRDSDPSRGYAAHRLTQSWDEGTVTWNNSPSYGAEIGRGTLGSTPGWQVTNITSEVKDWLRNPDQNKGVLLIGDERPDQNFERDYFSRQATSTGLTPYVKVTFETNKDDVAPVANVIQPSAGSWSPADFVVRWEGYDPPNSDGSPGSGIRWYDGYYTIDGGNSWRIGRAQVTTTQTEVTGAGNGLNIGFYVRARDNAGNEGPLPSGAGSIQTWTRIDAEPPDATVNPLPEASSHSFTVSWRDTRENSQSGLRYYDVQWRVENGQWQQLVYHTTATSTLFNLGQNGVTYEFRARGVDNVGNEQPWGPAQASTTVFTEPLATIVIPFTPPIYPLATTPMPYNGFAVEWLGQAPPGSSIVSFDVEFQRPGNPTWLNLYSGANTATIFTLAAGDPDGWYVFRAKAKDSTGETGSFHEELYGYVLVNRDGNFTPVWMPAIFSP